MSIFHVFLNAIEKVETFPLLCMGNVHTLCIIVYVVGLNIQGHTGVSPVSVVSNTNIIILPSVNTLFLSQGGIEVYFCNIHFMLFDILFPINSHVFYTNELTLIIKWKIMMNTIMIMIIIILTFIFEAYFMRMCTIHTTQLYYSISVKILLLTIFSLSLTCFYTIHYIDTQMRHIYLMDRFEVMYLSTIHIITYAVDMSHNLIASILRLCVYITYIIFFYTYYRAYVRIIQKRYYIFTSTCTTLYQRFIYGSAINLAVTCCSYFIAILKNTLEFCNAQLFCLLKCICILKYVLFDAEYIILYLPYLFSVFVFQSCFTYFSIIHYHLPHIVCIRSVVVTLHFLLLHLLGILGNSLVFFIILYNIMFHYIKFCHLYILLLFYA